jgi:hypothetical protein
MRTLCTFFALPLVVVAGLATSGCAVKGNYLTNHSHLALSANDILQKEIRGVEAIKKDDRIVIVNLTSVLLEDESVVGLLEDALINAVVSTGARVVERDSEGLRFLAQEGSGGDISYGVKGYSPNPAQPLVVDAELMDARRQVPGQRYLVDGEYLVEVPEGTDLMELGPDGGDDRVTRVGPPNEPRLVNKVQTATKQLEYRVIDVSIRNQSLGGGLIRRHANVVLHLRIVEVDTGLVVWAGYVEEAMPDEVPSNALFRLMGAPGNDRGTGQEASPRKRQKVGEVLGGLPIP